LFLFGWPQARAQSQTLADSLSQQRVLAVLEELQNSSLLRHGTVALSVRRVRDGQLLLSYNARMSLPPASTFKLVTTATSLAVLGESFRFDTYLEYDGQLRDSVLTGNLYLRGTGDPSLGSSRFPETTSTLLTRRWREAIQAAGIRRIEGRIIGDARAVTALPLPNGWPWGDIGNYYGAGQFGLNFNENLYRVIFQPDRTVSRPARILRTEPPTPYLQFNNRVLTGPAGSGDEVTIYNAPYSTAVFLEGTVPAGASNFPVRGALPNPAYAAAFALQQELQQAGITVSEPIASYGPGSLAPVEPPQRPLPRTVLSVHTSPLLAELVQQTNYQSINLYAEALLLATGKALAKRPVSTGEALEQVANYWRTQGVELSGFRPRDGSGLTPKSSLTADNLSGILASVSKLPAFAPFYESIPVVGESGTVRNLARRTAAAGNVRAKSGTLEAVRAYAGYATGRDGELRCFSIMVNQYQPGTLSALTPYLERILVQLASWDGTP